MMINKLRLSFAKIAIFFEMGAVSTCQMGKKCENAVCWTKNHYLCAKIEPYYEIFTPNHLYYSIIRIAEYSFCASTGQSHTMESECSHDFSVGGGGDIESHIRPRMAPLWYRYP